MDDQSEPFFNQTNMSNSSDPVMTMGDPDENNDYMDNTDPQQQPYASSLPSQQSF